MKITTGRPGIYAIRNTCTGTVYVGSSVNVGSRLSAHRTDLRRGRHDNIHLQRAFDRDGEHSFSFHPLAYIEVADLRDTEQRLLDRLVGTRGCYNIGRDACASTRGLKMRPEVCARMSAAKRGKPGHPCSAEARAKISLANRGRPSVWKGKNLPLETRIKISAAGKGKSISEKQKDKLRQANLGKRASASTRAKMSEMRRGRKRPPFSPEWRSNMAAAKRGKATGPHSAEWKANISAALRGRLGHIPGQETRQKMRDSAARRIRAMDGTFAPDRRTA
jgi:group I intron endonuclease